MSAAKILLVEDEGIEALDAQQRLTRLGYSVPEIAFTGEDAVRLAEEMSPDLVLMDIMLRGKVNGIQAAREIRSRFDIPVIYVTAYSDEDTLSRAKIAEPHGYIVKPYDERELRVAIEVGLYRHDMERRLRESERWLATALKSIGDAVIITDNAGVVTFVNPVAEKLIGFTLDEAKGQRLTDVFPIVNMYSRKPIENPVTRVLEEGVTVGLANHTVLLTRDGREISIDDSAAPILDDKGNVLGVILVFRDVTERVEVERTLRESEERYRSISEQLKDANRRKNDFMAILSHELRNPLASIQSGLSILKHVEPGGDQAKRALAIIHRQTAQLSRLVNDLMDINRIEQNKLQLQLRRLDLVALMKQVLEDHRPLFDRSGVTLRYELPPSPVYLNADENRLIQIVGNLLHNATKFVERGGVTDVELEIDPARGKAQICVRDNGIGMSEDMLARLFSPFEQADVTISRSNGGLGLGLALCKRLVELHDGRISGYSAGLGKGSEFVITLPVEATLATDVRRSLRTSAFRSRRVLILDDNADVAESIGELLTLKGHQVKVAYSGPEGIERAKQFSPEVLLCDIGLPRMNGYEVARVFREDPSLKHVWLVAVTGHTFTEDVKRATDAGFDRHVAKPVDLEELDRILSEAGEQE